MSVRSKRYSQRHHAVGLCRQCSKKAVTKDRCRSCADTKNRLERETYQLRKHLGVIKTS